MVFQGRSWHWKIKAERQFLAHISVTELVRGAVGWGGGSYSGVASIISFFFFFSLFPFDSLTLQGWDGGIRNYSSHHLSVLPRKGMMIPSFLGQSH